MRRRAAIAVLAAAVLAGCAALPDPAGTEAVSSAYAAGGGRYDDGATVIFLVRAFERDGRAGICGVRTAHSMTGRTLFLNEHVARAALVTLAGDPILRGLRNLPEARFRPDMTGATARCLLTDRPWRAAYSTATPEIRIPRLQFPEGDGNGFGALGWGESVAFRPAPVLRPLP